MTSRGKIRNRASSLAELLAALLFAVLSGSLPSASFATTPTPTPTRQAAILAFESDPNDYLGAGQTKVFTDADGVFVASHEPGLVVVDFEGSDSYWSLDFKAPRRGELLPGVYEGASNGLGITNPHLQIIGEHRFCAGLSGQFVVLEAAYTSNGDVERFAVDFEIHCEFREPIFFGYLRIGSKIAAPPRRTATPTPGPDSFVLQIDSDREDPVGRGYRGTLRADEGPVVAQYFLYPWADWRPHLNLELYNERKNWNLTFASPICGDMVPGAYEGATEFPREGPTDPGILISVGNSRCADVDGRFVIREARYGPFKEVYRFVADFEQRCHGAQGALRGSVSFTSVRPTPTPAPPTPTPSDYSTMAALNSQLGDFVGHCRAPVLTLADGEFSAAYDSGHVAILFLGGHATVWVFQFAAPKGEPLLPGTYRNVARWPFTEPDQPGMDVSGEGRGCDRLGGLFTVHEAEFGVDGEVLRFAADFEQHCEGAETPLYGTVRFRSSLPAPTGPPGKPPTVTPTPGPCWGDCSEDGAVTVDELILGVNMALDRDVGACSRFDVNKDDTVSIDELVAAVTASLFGCDPNLPTESDGA